MIRARRAAGVLAALVALSALIAQPAEAQTIQVLEATYGANCGVPRGNATAHVAARCDGRANCRYRIWHRLLGDPAYGCAKEFIVHYRCLPDRAVRACRVGAEAGWGGENGNPNYYCALQCSRGGGPD